jgi:hypothetical protein
LSDIKRTDNNPENRVTGKRKRTDAVYVNIVCCREYLPWVAAESCKNPLEPNPWNPQSHPDGNIDPATTLIFMVK